MVNKSENPGIFAGIFSLFSSYILDIPVQKLVK